MFVDQPYGQLPVLTVDGEKLAQSGAIVRYLAKRFDLLGANDWEAAKADELFGFFYDTMREQASRLLQSTGRSGRF